MTICIATSNFPPQTGGIATFYGHLAAMLNMKGHRVIVLLPDNGCKDGMEDEVLLKEGISIVLLRKKYKEGVTHYSKYFSPGGLDAPGWIAAGIAMKEWLLTNHINYGIDIIEVSDYGGLGAFLVHPQLPPVIITGHGAFVQLKRYNAVIENSHTRIISRLEMLAFQRADGVLAHSPFNQSDLEQLVQRKIDFATGPWQNTEHPLMTKKNNSVLTAGGLQQVKGAIVMAEAMQRLSTQEKKIIACWAGGDTFTAPGAIRMSVYLEKRFPAVWNSHFIWLNELTPAELSQKIYDSEIVVIPSLWETFNYVALEAAALHTPIIITDKTGAAYLFTHGHDAWIVPAGNGEQLANAIIHLQNNPALRNELAAHAAQTIKNTFNAKKIVEERITCYNHIIETRKLHLPEAGIELNFLQSYMTTGRNYYFRLRALLKKWLGRR